MNESMPCMRGGAKRAGSTRGEAVTGAGERGGAVMGAGPVV